jgi:hypothetical protein
MVWAHAAACMGHAHRGFGVSMACIASAPRAVASVTCSRNYAPCEWDCYRQYSALICAHKLRAEVYAGVGNSTVLLSREKFLSRSVPSWPSKRTNRGARNARLSTAACTRQTSTDTVRVYARMSRIRATLDSSRCLSPFKSSDKWGHSNLAKTGDENIAH